ncbi:MAG: hypothetical protein RDU20_00530 [Desulfomonilaceae bacterium]|nr:hypothetical protein [Desulfomonilaceae bacterium]
MAKIVRLMVVVVALVAFGLATPAVAAEFYVVKDAAGDKLSVTDQKPADAKLIVKGPFKTKAEADDALKQIAAESAAKPPEKAASTTKKPVAPPEEGC